MHPNPSPLRGQPPIRFGTAASWTPPPSARAPHPERSARREDRCGTATGSNGRTKPFSPAELAVRVRAAFRGRAKAEPFRLGELVILHDERQVTVAGR